MMWKSRGKLIKSFVLMNLCFPMMVAAFVLLAWIGKEFNIPIFFCLMSDIFHIYCPLCGGTRAIFDLLRLDFAAAFLHNSLILYLIAAVLVYDAGVAIKIFRGGERPFDVPRWLGVVTVVIFAVFFVLRNVLMLFFGIDPVGDLVGFWHS